MAEGKSFVSDFSYWGSRTYVHGSHMIYGLQDAVTAWQLGAIMNMSAQYRSKLESQGIYLLYENKDEWQSDQKQFCSSFDITTSAGHFFVGLTPDSSKAVAGRLPDNEDEIVASHTIDKETMIAAVIDYPEQLKVNAMIALHKKLLFALLPTEGYTPWLLGRLDLDLGRCAQAPGGTITVRLISNILNRAVRSAVSIDGQPVGEIYFNRNVAP